MTKEQKADLLALTKHKGFKLLEQIVEDKRQALFTEFETLSLGDEKVLQKLNQTQNFNKGMKYLIDTAKAKTQTTAKAKDMS